MPCRWIAFAFAPLLLLGPAAQAQIRANAPVDVLGQVYAPRGGPLPRAVRLNFTSENGMRPPDIIYSDSNGRFVIYGLAAGENYTLTVDEEPPDWGQTVLTFMPIGRRPTVQIYLNAYSKPRPDSPGISISAVALRNDIPRKARKEFEKGMKEIDQNENGKAQKHFEKAVKLHPDFVEARNELAVTLMKDGKLSQAEQQLNTALQVDPVAVLPLMNLGLCIYRQERYVAAAEPLERAVQLQPGNFRAHLLLGMTLVMSGDDPRSEATLLRAYALGGAKAARAQFYLSHYYTRNKSYGKAAQALEIYLHDVPDDPDMAELTKTLNRLHSVSVKN